MTQFASGKLAFGFCDICGFRYNLDELKELKAKRDELKVEAKSINICCDAIAPEDHLSTFQMRMCATSGL